MQLLTQGTERVRIDTAGNVGIGTTTPQYKLSVDTTGDTVGVSIGQSGLATGKTLDLGYFLTGDYGRIQAVHQGTSYKNLALNPSGGNVGIGTTSPASKLHVADSSYNYQLLLDNTIASGSSVMGFTVGGATKAAIGIAGAANGLLTGSASGDLVVRSNTGANSILLSANASTPHMAITSTGNVGIGTTTPTYKLTIAGTNTAGPGSSAQLAVGDGGDGNVGKMLQIGYNTTDDYGWMQPVHWGNGYKNLVLNQNGGNVGIGTTSPQSKLHIANGFSGAVPLSGTDLTVERSTGGYVSLLGPGTGDNGILFGNPTSNADGGIIYDPVSTPRGLQFRTGGNQTRLTINSSGNVGIGTTSPTAQLHTTGTVRFSNFGAGTLTTDASGNLSVSSDERLKNIDGAFSRGLADIVQLNPINYHWSATSGLDTSTQYAGFSAQNVQKAIPEAVGSSTSGYLTLQDRPLIAAIVNAIKELAQQVTELAERVVTKELVAVNGTFRNIRAEELCFGDSLTDESPVCLTKSQVAAVLTAAGQTAVTPSTNAPAGAPQAPVLKLNGNATSSIEIGDSYNDLGSRIVAPESDLNLGIVILLDGATTTAISIDTSQPGEYIILYTVTSPTSGLTGRAMRTVIVSPAELSPAPAEDTNPFNVPPSNDNASSTAVVDVAA